VDAALPFPAGRPQGRVPQAKIPFQMMRESHELNIRNHGIILMIELPKKGKA
jgi:hypothetical protein